MNCGAKGSRTPDLTDANRALSQLSYSPMRAFLIGPKRERYLATNREKIKWPIYFPNGMN